MLQGARSDECCGHGPGVEHEIRQGMPTGEKVTVTGRSGDWLQFTRAGEQVWSHGDYLEPEVQEATYKVVEGVWLRARSGLGLEHPMVSVLEPGSEITATGEKDGWISFTSGDQTLWSHSYYLKALDGADVGEAAGGEGTAAEAPRKRLLRRKQRRYPSLNLHPALNLHRVLSLSRMCPTNRQREACLRKSQPRQSRQKMARQRTQQRQRTQHQMGTPLPRALSLKRLPPRAQRRKRPRIVSLFLPGSARIG